MPVHIIHINCENTELLNSIAGDVFDNEINPDFLSDYVKDKNHIMLIALKNNIVVGQVSSVIHRHIDKPMELYIDNLGVTPSCQRQGIATKLVKSALTIAKKVGCGEIWVAVEPKNQQAKYFYASLNYSMQKALIFEGCL